AIVQPPPLPVERDADGDGVIDADDRCPNTPAGAIVDAQGCPIDSDRDGVPDGLDDCPNTPPEAAGYIDIYGCPVDSDFDGVPDFRDSCPDGPVGAMVDAKGCPIDSDGDGVPDGLDDCPGTEAGIEVDSRGCIDVAFLRDTVRIYVNYFPGSFEIDERTKARLEPLVKKLLILKDVSFEIVGYSDNVGTPEANEMLSQKRANRMRDWLESVGIARERMTPVGRGEVNFLDSNDTAEGRTKNRRLELIFKTP
ncbi:MAG: OmpA family protein, partial [candidate division Zixibacteria bacterium]|nr:OmpA family protein [candidate division Zixibacteria bacterium]